jgi:hypothetical protein
MTSINLAECAFEGKLTVEDVNRATKEKLEEDKDSRGRNVLYCSIAKCGIEVVEAILNKNFNINKSLDVSIVVVTYY